MNAAWLTVFSDLLVNLAAGWIGAVIIVPNFSKVKGLRKFAVLFWNTTCAIVSLLIAYLLRSNL